MGALAVFAALFGALTPPMLMLAACSRGQGFRLVRISQLKTKPSRPRVLAGRLQLLTAFAIVGSLSAGIALR
jgi:hypothetical protein